MEKIVKYTAEGFVLGFLWGGGMGAYPTIEFEADTKEELLEKAKLSLDDGSMDSGMGFETLKGAVLEVKKITSIEFEGNIFTNKEFDFEYEIVGKLTDKEGSYLIDCVITKYVN
jgi:hypothetical protein